MSRLPHRYSYIFEAKKLLRVHKKVDDYVGYLVLDHV